MPTYQSYIATIDSPGFYWDDIPDDKFRTGNSPSRFFPNDWHINLPFGYRWIKTKIDSGECTGQQIDWGGWAIIATKAQLIQWLNDVDKTVNSDRYKTLIEEAKLILDDHSDYLLVVLENA